MLGWKTKLAPRWILVLLTAGLLFSWTGVAPGPAVLAAPPDPQDAVVIFTRDVFVVVGSTLRNPDDTTAPDAPVFNVAAVNLGFTWGQWKSATASSTARVSGKSTDVRIEFRGLVPNGVYSVFYGTIIP